MPNLRSPVFIIKTSRGLKLKTHPNASLNWLSTQQSKSLLWTQQPELATAGLEPTPHGHVNETHVSVLAFLLFLA